jgi:uncharacterized cupredoxin-like copper-binding protein
VDVDQAQTAEINLIPTVVVVLLILAASLVALGIGLWARHHAHGQTFSGSEKVVVHETSFHIALSTGQVTEGKVGFDVFNDANIPHEFVVFKTDLFNDQLPLGTDGDVIEDSPNMVDVVDSGASIKPGDSKPLFGRLKAGHYVIVCNLPGHYKSGMHVDFTVAPAGS